MFPTEAFLEVIQNKISDSADIVIMISIVLKACLIA